jgi:hypothetical protein
MIGITQQKIINQQGRLTGVLLKSADFNKLSEYIEDLEDSLELAQVIKNSEGFILWDDFVKEYRNK